MKSGEKRDKILAAALELMVEKGFHGVPMSLIATRSQVAIGTIYLYFPGKDALINETYRLVEQRIAAVLKQNPQCGASLREHFVHMMTLVLRYLIDNPMDFHYVEQYHNSPYGFSLRRAKFSRRPERETTPPDQHDELADLLEEGIATGVIKNLPLPVLMALGIGPLIFLARDHALDFAQLNDDLIKRAVYACWDAIRIQDRPGEDAAAGAGDLQERQVNDKGSLSK